MKVTAQWLITPRFFHQNIWYLLTHILRCSFAAIRIAVAPFVQNGFNFSGKITTYNDCFSLSVFFYFPHPNWSFLIISIFDFSLNTIHNVRTKQWIHSVKCLIVFKILIRVLYAILWEATLLWKIVHHRCPATRVHRAERFFDGLISFFKKILSFIFFLKVDSRLMTNFILTMKNRIAMNRMINESHVANIKGASKKLSFFNPIYGLSTCLP